MCLLNDEVVVFVGSRGGGSGIGANTKTTWTRAMVILYLGSRTLGWGQYNIGPHPIPMGKANGG